MKIVFFLTSSLALLLLNPLSLFARSPSYAVSACYHLNARGELLTHKILAKYEPKIIFGSSLERSAILERFHTKRESFESNGSLGMAIIYSAVLSQLDIQDDTSDVCINNK